MTTPDSTYFDSYLPVYDVIPEKWEDARPAIVEFLKRVSNAVNAREIGFFLDEEVLSGKQFIPSDATALLQGTSPQFRSVLRTVVDTGQLPNNSFTQTPHGINFDSNFTLVQLYGAATEPPPGKTAIPLPNVDVGNSLNDVQIYIDGVYVNIFTTSNQSKYTRSFVVIEYIQEL